VYSATFSPDGRTLAASSADQTIWLWNVSDLRHPVQLAKLTAATGAVHTALFSPDGRIVAGGSSDRTARLWHVDPDFAADFVCTVSGTPITPAEWSQYVPGIPYRNPCG
jgi:WD40 repeat protein